MGQTDSQFKCNIRFMLDAIRDARNEKDTESKDQLLDRILENLQKTKRLSAFSYAQPQSQQKKAQQRNHDVFCGLIF